MNHHINRSLLFSSFSLNEFLDGNISDLRDEVEKINSDEFLNISKLDLCKYFLETYTIDVPVLNLINWRVDHSEEKVEIKDPQSRQMLELVQRIEVEIPFDGEKKLFYSTPRTYTTTFPRGVLRGESILLLEFYISPGQQHDTRMEIDKTVKEIEGYLSWVKQDVDSYNRNLEQVIESAIEGRRQRILTNKGKVASLGIPLKIRVNTPNTYSVPNIRKKVLLKLPIASSDPYDPEPVLDMEMYEHILNVIQNMTQVMERSPSAFMSMGEEDIRQHYLVQLNGHLEGAATAETFNVEGKTDILIRYKDRNIFIAECKFWKGPKHYSETIDQLLSYKAWRDTKTAILLFNRNTQLTTILQGIKSATENHQNYKKTLNWKHDTGFRFILHHKGDINRDFFLTVLVFDIPCKID
jgi:hypothetical protein